MFRHPYGKMIKAIIFDWTGAVYERNKGLFSFTKEVLDKLKPNYKFGLISKSSNPETRRLEIAQSGIEDYFDYIKVVDKKGRSEFMDCIDELGMRDNLNKVLVVDDRMSRGIETGNILGCKTCWIQFGDRSFDCPTIETGEPNYKINSIKELPNLLN